MREILFKAKRLDNGKWVEGCYFKSFDAYSEKEQHWIIETHCYFFGHYEGFSDPYEIDINTLCQFTGVTDKNGNKIWENDIVDVSDCWWDISGSAGYDSPIVLVEWNDYNCGFDPFSNYDCDCGAYYSPEKVKVIGNKFDNPELLEV